MQRRNNAIFLLGLATLVIALIVLVATIHATQTKKQRLLSSGYVTAPNCPLYSSAAANGLCYCEGDLHPVAVGSTCATPDSATITEGANNHFYNIGTYADYSTSKEEAYILVEVSHANDPVNDLMYNNFKLQTVEFAPGGCSVGVGPKYEPVHKSGGGEYVFHLIPHDPTQTCSWHAGEYDLSITVSTGQGSGTGTVKFSVPTDGKNVYSSAGEVVSPVAAQPSQPTPLMIKWLSPLGPITAHRGDTISLRWQLLQEPSIDTHLSILLYPAKGNGSGEELGAPAIAQSESYRITAPPGDYSMQVAPSPAQPDIFIPLSIVGAPPKVSNKDSVFDYASEGPGYSSNKIINDGACGASIGVALRDTFGWAMPRVKVDMKSSRGSLDTILSQALWTNSDGEIYFRVVSQTVGTATLTAYVNGDPLSQTLSLEVTDSAKNSCEQ